MSENYKFFQHKNCEYFPCHSKVKPEEFNCLFCYCPLYTIEGCGGNNSYHKGIKICTACTKPHVRGGYNDIIERLIDENNKKCDK